MVNKLHIWFYEDFYSNKIAEKLTIGFIHPLKDIPNFDEVIVLADAKELYKKYPSMVWSYE